MRSMQTFFFATLKDIEPMLREFESCFSITYFELGMFDYADEIVQHSSVFDIPQVGKAKAGDWNNDRRMLVTKAEDILITRAVPQRKGGIKYTFDMAINSSSIYLQLGGLWMDNIIVAGKVAIINKNEFPAKMYKHLSHTIKKEFKRIGSFYVGSEAEEKMCKGWRLVTSIGSPKEYDLKYE